MKKFLTVSIITSSLALAQTAWGQTSPADVIKEQCSKVKEVVELWHGFTTPVHANTLLALTVEFNKSQKDACILPVAQGSYRDLSTKIKAAFAAGKVPTIAQGYENNMAMYLEANKLANLGALGVKTQYLQKNFVKAATFNGVLYGIPASKSVQMMYYNKDLLKKHNAKVPQTLDQFANTVRDLSKKENAPVFWYVPDASIFSYIFFSLGGDYMPNGKLTLNSPTAIKTLQWLVDLTKDGAAKAITNGYINGQLNNTFGFSFDTSAGSSFYYSAAKFNLGMATLPGVKAGVPGTALIQGTNLVIFKDAPKSSQNIAAKFLNFASTPRNSAIFAIATGYAPSSDLAAEQDIFKNYLAKSPDYASVLKQVRFADFEPRLADWEQIRFDILGDAIKQVVAGKMEVKEALDAAQKKAEALMK